MKREKLENSRIKQNEKNKDNKMRKRNRKRKKLNLAQYTVLSDLTDPSPSKTKKHRSSKLNRKRNHEESKK